MGRPPVSFGFAHRSVTDLLSKSTILGSPGALGGPAKLEQTINKPSRLIIRFEKSLKFLEFQGLGRHNHFW